jgi:SAM-dependent methyltransferase
VLAVDRDRDALARLPAGAQPLCADLEGAPWPSELAPASQFDAIVVANYLFRPRLDLLPACLAPGGLMLYETFAAGNARYGRPANPAFLLEPGELFAWAARHGLLLPHAPRSNSPATPWSRSAARSNRAGRASSARIAALPNRHPHGSYRP